MKICGQVNTPTTNNEPIPCKNFYSAECIIYQDPIAYFGYTDPTPAKDLFDTIIQSLSDARGRIYILENALPGSGGGDSVWGGITGTLTDQTDLSIALNGKAGLDNRNIFTTEQVFQGPVGLQASNFSGVSQTNYIGLDSRDVFYFSKQGHASKGLLLDVSNTNSMITLDVPNKSGEIALLSDLPSEYTSVTTTTGDLIARNSVRDQRLAIGTVGQVLTADPTSNIGMSWQTPSTGGGTITDYVDLTTNQSIAGTKTWTGTALFDGVLAARNGFQITDGADYSIRMTKSTANPNGYTTSALFWTNADGNLSYNKPSGGTTFYGYTLETNNTDRRNYTFQDADGTIAFLSDIPTGGTITDYVDLTTDQFISGRKSFRDITTLQEGALIGKSSGDTLNLLQIWQSTLPSGADNNGATPALRAGSNSEMVWLGKSGKGAMIFKPNSTTAKTYTLPTSNGTLALVSDIPTTIDQVVGTFTPTVALSTDTQTVGFASGTYVKTGRLLTFTIELSAISTTGTNTNAPTIGGLPFNPASLTTRIDIDLQNSTFTDGSANPIDESRAVIVSVSGTNLVIGYKNNTAASYSPRLTFPGGSGSITLHGSCVLLP